MKKINSIWYGSRILVIGGFFAVVIPFILYLFYISNDKNEDIMILIRFSIAIGIIILIMFSLMLAVEFKQDRNINLQYNKVKYQKIKISDGLYECQYCGNQKVKKEDSFCKVCYIKFKS